MGRKEGIRAKQGNQLSGSRVFPRNNKVWAHGPMSLKFDGPFL